MYMMYCIHHLTPRSPDQAKVCVRSEGASPGSTRAPSLPSLNEIDIHLPSPPQSPLDKEGPGYSHNYSLPSPHDNEMPMEVSSPENHLSTSTEPSSSTDTQRTTHLGSCTHHRHLQTDVGNHRTVSGKQGSIESSDSQEEPESCLIKDRTSSKSISASKSVHYHEETTNVDREYLCSTDTLDCEGDEPGEEELVEFCVGDVRKRLSQHSSAPKKTFQRDPEDPSGLCYPSTCTCVID